MRIFNSLPRPFLRSVVRVKQHVQGLPAKLASHEPRYSLPVMTRLSSVSASVSQKVSDKIDGMKDKIDSVTSPGTAQACLDTGLLLLSSVITAPLIAKTVANVCWANLKRFSPEQVTLEGQDFVRLYRGITKQEFNRLLAEPKGPLFGLDTDQRTLGMRDVMAHVLGTYSQDKSRVFTSFSTEKALAAQFAGIYDPFAAIASLLVPKSLYESSFCGMNVHREVLLPTHAVDLSMITSVELRSKEELQSAKARELLCAIQGGLTEDSHRFDTPPLLTFDPRNAVQRMVAALKIQSLQV